MTLALARTLNLLLSLVGAASFAALFLYVSLAPQDFDRQVRTFAISRVQERVNIGARVERLIADLTSEDGNQSAIGNVIARAIPARIKAAIQAYYHAIMDELRGDVKIFSGSSFLAFLFALALSLFRGNTARHLLPVSLALSMATLLAASWYVFGQDWVMAILFNDYWGWTYAALLSGLTLLMIDIAINKARITTQILNGIGDAIGQSFALVPC